MTDRAIPPEIGKYRILRPLGQGGMGQVYLAQDTALQRQVAIKCLRPELDDAHWQENLKREALVLARLNHPNIVQIHDIVECDNSVAIVTEFVDGRNLHILLRERVASYVELTRWLAEIAAGLAAAHRAGISHNDLKAENILVGPDGTAKINDFGIASTEDDPSGDILALGNLAREVTADCTAESPLLYHLLERMTDRRPARRPSSEEAAGEFRQIWLESTQAETPLPGAEPASTKGVGPGAAWLAGAALALAACAGAWWYLGNPAAGQHTYVAVLPTRLDVDDTTETKKYALLASSVQQGLYQAVMDAPGYSLVSPAETGQQKGSPGEVAAAVRADELLVPAITCLQQHCELSTERLVAPDFRTQKRQSTTILPEQTLDAFEIAQRQWDVLFDVAGSDRDDRQSISEDDYRRFLELYEGAHHGRMPLAAILDQLDRMLAGDVRFLPATMLYVHTALDLYYQTREDSYLQQAREALRQADRWADNSVLLQKAWFSLALESGDFPAADREIAALENMGADDALLLSLKGDLHRYQGDYEAASGFYTAALRLRPTKATYTGAAHNAYLAGNDDRALELANQAIAQFQDDGTLATLRGLILLDRGQLEPAIADFQAAIDRRPQAASHSNLGLAYLLRGDYGEARNEFIRAREIGDDGQHVTLTLNLADALLLLGRDADARALYASLVKEYEQSPSSIGITDAAQAYAHLGEYQRAIQILDSIPTKSAETWFAAALVYTLAGQSVAATAKVDQALAAKLGAVWFRLPWFDELCSEPEFVRAMSAAGDSARCGS